MTVKNRAVIIAGGEINDDLALSFIQEDSYIIAADRGLDFLARHDILPDLVVGDFDSAREETVAEFREAHPGIEVREYNWEKEYTDLEIAAVAAADRGFEQIDILGATGTRIDHMIGALQTLALLLDRGCRGCVIDPCNRITMHDDNFSIRKDSQWGRYVSLFAWGGPAEGITLKGFHFPMENGTITTSGTLAISNQIEADEAEVCFKKGRLLLIESADMP